MGSVTKMGDSSLEVIRQFFDPKHDAQQTENGYVRRSVLLTLVEDLKYCIQLPDKLRPLDLTDYQTTVLSTMLPSFAIISLFCTAVDVLARVTKGRKPKNHECRSFFIWASKEFMLLDAMHTKELWDLRNGIVHSYSLKPGHAASRLGQVMLSDDKNGHTTFHLPPMLSKLLTATTNALAYCSELREEEKIRVAEYIQENGFYYVK